MTVSANDLLMGGGVAAAKFPAIGTVITGRIVRAPEARQQTDIESGEPLTFANGDPRMQIVCPLATELRDPANPDDNGDRNLYIKGNMLNAVRDAVKKAGAKGLEVGGTLTITYIADGEKKNRAFNAPKLYSALYAPPTAEAANALLMGAPAPAQQWSAPVMSTASGQPVVYQQPVPPIPAAAMAPAPAGVDPNLWARMDPSQRAAVQAAMGQTPPF